MVLSCTSLLIPTFPVTSEEFKRKSLNVSLCSLKTLSLLRIFRNSFYFISLTTTVQVDVCRRWNSPAVLSTVVYSYSEVSSLASMHNMQITSL